MPDAPLRGNDYDFEPPKEPESEPQSHKPGQSPARLQECTAWLAAQLTPNPVPLKDLRTEAEAAGFSTNILYKAKEALQVDEYTLDRRKWWKMPLDADVGEPLPF